MSGALRLEGPGVVVRIVRLFVESRCIDLPGRAVD
jgi:hypothetical protein